MWLKKPTKKLEKPYVGAYSHHYALHSVVKERQTVCKEERLHAPVAFFLHPFEIEGRTPGEV